MDQIFGWLAGGLSLIAWLTYIGAVIRGTTKPNRATWWILTLVGLMILISYYEEGARTTIWVPVMYVVGPLTVALLSLRYGDGSKWESLDKWCLGGSLTGAVLWAVSGSALAGLLINILVDLVGIIPTIRKSYLRPEGEDVTAWVFEAVASFLNLGAVTVWAWTLVSFAIWIYPIYMAIFNGLIAGLLIYGKFKKS